MTDQDRALLLKVAKGYDQHTKLIQSVIRRLDRLERNDTPTAESRLRMLVTYHTPTLPPIMEQFKMELMLLCEEYGVRKLEGVYEEQ